MTTYMMVICKFYRFQGNYVELLASMLTPLPGDTGRGRKPHLIRHTLFFTAVPTKQTKSWE